MLDILFQENDVILLQECGELANIEQLSGSGEYFLNQPGKDDTHFSSRVAILSRLPIAIPSSQKSEMVIAVIGGYSIASLHASCGNETAADVQEALRHVSGRWIVGGDMNCKPHELSSATGISAIYPKRKAVSSIHKRIAASGKPTFPSNNAEYDYFVVAEGVVPKSIHVYPESPSDHLPVSIEIRDIQSCI